MTFTCRYYIQSEFVRRTQKQQVSKINSRNILMIHIKMFRLVPIAPALGSERTRINCGKNLVARVVSVSW